MIWPIKNINNQVYKNLNSREAAVLVALACFADKKWKCFPSIRKLSDFTRMKPHTICKAIFGLEKKKGIMVKRTRGDVNQYDLSQWNKT